MSSKEQQIKNSFIYLLPIIFDNVAPFLTLPFFTRILTPQDYGVLALAQVYAIFANGFTNLGLIVSYDRNYFQYHHDRLKTAQLFFSTVLFVFLNSCLFGVLTYLLQDRLSHWVIREAHYGNLLLAAFAAQSFVSLRQYYLVYFRNDEKAKDYTRYYLIGTVATFFLSFYMVVFLRTGVIGLVYAELIASVFVCVLLQMKFMKMFPFSLNKSLLLEELKISFPLIPRIFFGVISTQFDKYMLGLLASLGGVGIFSFGQKISYVIFVYMTSLQNVFQPQMYKNMFESKETSGQTIGKYLTPFIYMSILIGLMIALFAEEIVFMLAPPAYYGAVDVIIVLSMYYGFLFFGKIVGAQFLFKKKTFLLSALSIVTIVLNIILNIPFILKWGAIGAAWATFWVGMITGVISFIAGQRYFKIDWEYPKVASIFLIFFASAVSMIVLRQMNSPYFIRLVFKMAAVGWYLYEGIRFHILSKENFLMLKGIVWPKPLMRSAIV